MHLDFYGPLTEVWRNWCLGHNVWDKMDRRPNGWKPHKHCHPYELETDASSTGTCAVCGSTGRARRCASEPAWPCRRPLARRLWTPREADPSREPPPRTPACRHGYHSPSSFGKRRCSTTPLLKKGNTVEPRYNEVLGTMKITLIYQVSHYVSVKNK